MTPGRCLHRGDRFVELHHGTAWVLLAPDGTQLDSGVDVAANPHVLVTCVDCGRWHTVTEGSLQHAPKWVREPARSALDGWWAREEGDAYGDRSLRARALGTSGVTGGRP